MNINERFENAIKELSKEKSHLAAEITKLGYPQISNDLPTASVAWDDKLRKTVFLFNGDFEKTLSDEEFNFVVAHEAMHVINLHIFQMRDLMKQAKGFLKPEELSKYHRKINVAADAVVNDSLTKFYGFNRFEELGKMSFGDKQIPLKPVYGQEIINMDANDMTLQEVLIMMPEDQKGQDGNECGHMWDSFFDENGNLKKEFVEKIKNFVDSKTNNSNVSKEDAEQVNKMIEAMKKSSDPNARQVGNQVGKQVESVARMGKDSICWDKIVGDFFQTRKCLDDWSRQNRKLMQVYPDVIVPSSVYEEKEKIVVFIDSSGSIDHNALQLFVNIARNTPRRFELDCYTFDTQVYPLNIKETDKIEGRGGTDFGILEEYILQNYKKKYPRCVIVLTDGEGTPISPKFPSHWGWLLYGSCSTNHIGNMKRYKIMELMNK